jgi:hypothetical protein
MSHEERQIPPRRSPKAVSGLVDDGAEGGSRGGGCEVEPEEDR